MRPGSQACARAEIRARCFGCGTRNPGSLGLCPRTVGGRFVAEFLPRPEHVGFPGALHGGVTAALLDEMMARPAERAARSFVATYELRVRYRRPVPSGQRVVVEAWLEASRGRAFIVRGALRSGRGEILATGRAEYRSLSGRKAAAFLAGSESSTESETAEEPRTRPLRRVRSAGERNVLGAARCR
ncbi:MAG: PaaI family thioesterase [Myxococcales bacterium]|nr:PaaI family thioesterase [Myxococcales bacterium]